MGPHLLGLNTPLPQAHLCAQAHPLLAQVVCTALEGQGPTMDHTGDTCFALVTAVGHTLSGRAGGEDLSPRALAPGQNLQATAGPEFAGENSEGSSQPDMELGLLL